MKNHEWLKLAIIKHFKKSNIIKEEWKGRLQGINEVCCAQQIYSELNSWRRDAVHNITTKGTKLYNELTEDKKKDNSNTTEHTWFPWSLLISESKKLTMLAHWPPDGCWGSPLGDLDNFPPCCLPVLGA